LNLTQTFTTNADARADGEAESITRIAPNVNVSSRSGRVQGYLDYTLSGVVYARDQSSNGLRNTLRSSGSAELIEQRAYVDAQASITQQSINPLEATSVDEQLNRANRTEVRTLQLTPRMQGRLGEAAQWDARVAHRQTHSSSTLSSSSSSTQAQLQLSNGEVPTAIRWSLQASHNVQDFSQGRNTKNDIVRGVLDWRFNPELFAGVIGGYETSDIASDDMQGRTTHGWRLSWAPSERTRLFMEQEKRFFGNAHNISFTHRMSRLVLRYTDSRNLSYGLGQSLQGTWYDLISQQYTSVTNEAERNTLVQQWLATHNVNGNSEAVQSFLSAAVTVQRVQQLSFAWEGLRDTLAFSLQQTSGRREDSAVVVDDVFSRNRDINLRGMQLTLSHRLTPLSTLTLGYNQRRTGGSQESITVRTSTLQWSTQLGPRTTFSLLGRRARSASSAQPYKESAAVGTFGMTF
jgi:uncharacterized protein (PEP-CTERM system associated)